MRHHHYTTTALALLFGLGVAATGSTPAAAQQSVTGQSMAAQICDRNNDGFIDSQESWVCADARFDEASGGGEYITEGQHFINLYAEADDPEGLFAEADADQDRRISRDEWRSWNEQRFAAASEATGGRMAVADYERFARGDEAIVAVVAAAEAGDVVAQLRESGNFSTFVRAIESAGLVEELRDAGPFTVFAPTDAAFNKLPQGALDQLMQGQDKSRIEDLVMHHVVLGEAHPADALPEQLDPLAGGPISVGIGDGGGAVLRPQGGQQVAVTREIPADNGYIQVIDAVLVPQQLAETLQTGQQQAQQSGQQGQQQSGQQQQAQQSGQQQPGGQGQQQQAQQSSQQGQQQSGGGQQGQQQATAAGGQQQQALFGGGEVTRDDWTSVGADTFAQADADQSGFVTEEELNRWAQTNWGGAPGGGDDDGPLFGLLDVNDDKQVTEDEWFTGESFGALDDDGSGVLEDDEFGV